MLTIIKEISAFVGSDVEGVTPVEGGKDGVISLMKIKAGKGGNVIFKCLFFGDC